MKLNLTKILPKTLSLRLSLKVVFAIALLLTSALVVMFHFSRESLRDEAMKDAEYTLEATSLHIDNILLSVEQTSGNYYWDLMRHLDQPERMEDYCRELVLSNRYIVGCAIAFKPYYYPAHEHFMAYVRRKVEGGNWETEEYDSLETLNPYRQKDYLKQAWYTEPMKKGQGFWTEPSKDGNPDDAIITFSLPIYTYDGTKLEQRDRSEPVGVMGVDIPLARLSDFILRAKPSANGYSVLLGRDGTFIVHPNSKKLFGETVFTQTLSGADPSVMEAAQAMVAGESGFMPYKMDGKQWYVIFKPFVRSAAPGRIDNDLKWSVGVAYPDDDIFNEYNKLLYYLIAIVFFGLLTFFLLYSLITHLQLLPLALLTDSAKRIADGNYDETIPNTKRDDEIGQLQEHFQQMQHALATSISRQEQVSQQLQERGEELKQAYRQAQEADRMKTSFLHYMTNQMLAPSDAINKSVTTICDHYDDINTQEASRQTDIIRHQSEEMLNLLDHVLHTADSDTRKEGAHE